MNNFKKSALVLIFLCAAAGAFCQVRGALRVFIPPVAGGAPEQKKFFEDQFKMEIQTAGYSIAPSNKESDFTLRLFVQSNTLYGKQEGEKQFDLIIALLQSVDNAELVRFTFPFDELEEMYDWNMFLVYQAMANIPAEAQEEAVRRVYGAGGPGGTAQAVEAEPALWRNKWIYLSFAIGGDMIYFLNPDTMTTAQGMVMPGAMIGAEFHVLSFLSIETDVKLRILHDGADYILAAVFPALLKGVIKPTDFLMIEPYVGVEYSALLATQSDVTEIPWFSALGGCQVAFRNGKSDAFFIDASVDYSVLGEIELINKSAHSTLIFEVQLGWKIGFKDRQ